MSTRIDGFVRSPQPTEVIPLPPPTPEPHKKDEAEEAAKLIETYLQYGVVSAAFLFKAGQGVVYKSARRVEWH